MMVVGWGVVQQRGCPVPGCPPGWAGGPRRSQGHWSPGHTGFEQREEGGLCLPGAGGQVRAAAERLQGPPSSPWAAGSFHRGLCYPVRPVEVGLWTRQWTWGALAVPQVPATCQALPGPWIFVGCARLLGVGLLGRSCVLGKGAS